MTTGSYAQRGGASQARPGFPSSHLLSFAAASTYEKARAIWLLFFRGWQRMMGRGVCVITRIVELSFPLIGIVWRHRAEKHLDTGRGDGEAITRFEL